MLTPLLLTLATWLPPQGPMESIGSALQLWHQDFARGRLGLSGSLRNDAQAPGYVRVGVQSGVLVSSDFERISHLEALQKLLAHAELQPGVGTAKAVLPLCAAEFERGLCDRDALELRRIGRESMRRMCSSAEVLGFVRQVANPAAGQPDAPPVGQRAAALVLLFELADPAAEAALTAALSVDDPRLRLCAAERLADRATAEQRARLRDVLADEAHPVVSQAVLAALGARLVADDASDDERREVTLAAITRLGRIGWRTDMEILNLFEQVPTREAVEPLIRVLARGDTTDKLLKAVRSDASPLLQERAFELLRAMTGAVLPRNDAVAWAKFWREEGVHIQVPRTLRRARIGNTEAPARFYNIPVTGREVLFLLDISGSMDRVVPGTRNRRGQEQTRWELTRDQLLGAVQAMDPHTRFHVVTFRDQVERQTREAMEPTRDNVRALQERLQEIQPDRGTDLGRALAAVLDAEQARFGELQESGVDEVFLISDGEPTTGELRASGELLDLVRSVNRWRKVRIHTVYIGNGGGAELMRTIAEENYGVFASR